MHEPTARALRIAGIYLAFSALWTLFADHVVEHLAPKHTRHITLESLEGLLFAAMTAALLFALLRRYFHHLEQSISLMRESEARFARVFDRSPHPKSISRFSDGRFLDVNQAFAQFFGYAREDVVGHTASELGLWGEPGREAVMGKLRRDVRVRDLEITTRLKSGEMRHVVASMELMALGGEDCVLGDLTDVTDQRRAEREVKLWADAFIHCAHGIAMGDATTNTLIACNPAMQKLLGLGAEVLAGRPILSSYVESDRARIEACLVEADRDGQVRYESHMQRADGTTFPVQMDVVSVRDATGHPQYRIATVQDITERRRSEVALRESEGRLRALGDNIPGGAIYRVVLDTAGVTRHTYISAGIEAILGWQADEFMADPAVFWASIEPADRNAVQAAQLESAITLTVFDREFRHRTKTGELRWVHASASPRRLPDGSTQWDGVVTDITARKQIESELAASRAQLETALSSMNDAVFISDHAGRFIHFNDAFATFHKFATRADCGRTLQDYPDLFEVSYPDGRLAPLEEWAVPRALRGESASNAEFNLRRKDTGETWVGSYSFAPIRDAAGAVVGSVVTARDITEIRKAAARERAIEARFRALIEHAPDGIALVDQAGHVIFASPSAQRMFGYADPGEIDSMDCTHPDDRAAVHAMLEDLMRTPAAIRRLPYRFRHRDGHWIFIESVFSNMLHVDGVQAIVINFRDITERRRMEDAVRAGEERYRAIVETSFDWVWEVDNQGCYTYASPRVTALLGYTPDQLIGRTPFDFMSPEEAQRVGGLFRDLVARRESFTALENTNRHQDGHLVVLETSARPIFDAAGRFCGYRGTDRDITERKRLEAQIRQSQKMEAVGRLAGGVAHDFNNILQAIFGFCDILLAATSEADRRRQDILEIQRSAGRAAGLTRQLLAFSRRQLITPTVLDLNHLAQNTEKMLRRLLGEDIQLTTALDENLFRIKADAGNLEQVIMNLAVNARDAMPEGGRITLSTTNLTLTDEDVVNLSEARPGSFVCLAVTDTGCGMTREVLAHIFEPFFTTKGPDKGTGLGLSVIYGILKQHEGWVNVYSEPGNGTTFKVFLPAYQAAPPEARVPEDEDEAPGRGRGERILLLEDDACIRLTVDQLLRNQGYEVEVVANVADAIQRFTQDGGRFDVFFTDVVLPDGNGFEVAARFRTSRPGLAVLLSSGYTDDRARWGESKALGFRFIQKPYAARALLHTMRRLLDGRTPPKA